MITMHPWHTGCFPCVQEVILDHCLLSLMSQFVSCQVRVCACHGWGSLPTPLVWPGLTCPSGHVCPPYDDWVCWYPFPFCHKGYINVPLVPGLFPFITGMYLSPFTTGLYVNGLIYWALSVPRSSLLFSFHQECSDVYFCYLGMPIPQVSPLLRKKCFVPL